MPRPTRKTLLKTLAKVDQEIADTERFTGQLTDPSNRPLYEELLELLQELRRRVEEKLGVRKKAK